MVLEKLRIRVEEKVSIAMNSISGNIEIIDLDIEELPETLLINCIRPSSEDTHQSVINPLRFLWEIYKLSLDLLKTNGRMVLHTRTQQ